MKTGYILIHKMVLVYPFTRIDFTRVTNAGQLPTSDFRKNTTNLVIEKQQINLVYLKLKFATL